MTRARKVLVAVRCTWLSSWPIVVYGPTMNTSSRPMTSGGSSRLSSTPASQTRGNGSVPRASIRASGVPSSRRTASVTRPDSSEMTSGSSAPGPSSAVTISCQDRWVSKVITGPSRASQITPAPITEATPAADLARRARPVPGGPGRGGPPPAPALPEAGAGLAAQLTADLTGYRARRPGQRWLQQGEPARLVLGQALLGQRVGHERDAGRGGLADDRDVDDLRRAILGRLGAARRGDCQRGLGVLVGVGEVAQVDRRRQLDVAQVQLDRLGDERAGRVELTGLQRGVKRGLGVDLRAVGGTEVAGA